MSTLFLTEIRPVTDHGDLGKIVDIEERAYGTSSPLLQLMFPVSSGLSSASARGSKVARHIHVWQSDPTVRYIKAITYEKSLDGAISERILGAAVYHIYESSHTAYEQNPWPRCPNEVPEGANAPLCLHYFQTLTKARLDFMEGEPHAFLANLVVDPSFQRRGVGTKLLDFMTSDIIARCTDEGREQWPGDIACWLDASPAGLKTYQRLGWEEVGAKCFDFELWGGVKGQLHKNVHMMKRLSVLDLDGRAVSQ